MLLKALWGLFTLLAMLLLAAVPVHGKGVYGTTRFSGGIGNMGKVPPQAHLDQTWPPNPDPADRLRQRGPGHASCSISLVSGSFFRHSCQPLPCLQCQATLPLRAPLSLSSPCDSRAGRDHGFRSARPGTQVLLKILLWYLALLIGAPVLLQSQQHGPRPAYPDYGLATCHLLPPSFLSCSG